MLLRFQGAPILTLTRLFRLCFSVASFSAMRSRLLLSLDARFPARSTYFQQVKLPCGNRKTRRKPSFAVHVWLFSRFTAPYQRGAVQQPSQRCHWSTRCAAPNDFQLTPILHSNPRNRIPEPPERHP